MFIIKAYSLSYFITVHNIIEVLNYGGPMQNLVGKKVIVETFETTYTGTLIELGDQEVYLQADTGWIVIPVDRVTNIQKKED